MLCGKCKNPILCKCCDETEHSQYVRDSHKFIPSDCEYCKENPTYVNLDFMWYFKTITDVIQALIFIVCLIGFVVTFIIMWFNNSVWVSNIMGWSVCVGFINGLFMISRDRRWREDYIDRSLVRNIKE